jgi:hypothetical protein
MPAIKKSYKHIPIEIFVVFVIASSFTDDNLRSVIVDVITAVTFRGFWFDFFFFKFKERRVIFLYWLLWIGWGRAQLAEDFKRNLELLL